MWIFIAKTILKNRIPFLVILGLITIILGYVGRNAEITYDYVRVVPQNDSDMVYYNKFRETFGDDANFMVVGVKDSSLYRFSNFLAWKKLCDTIKEMRGVTQTYALCNINNLVKDTATRKFKTVPLLDKDPSNQEETDSILRIVHQLEFYKHQLINPQNGATLLGITFDKKILNSQERIPLIEKIIEHATHFSSSTDIKTHYAGIPYMRTVLSTKVRKELFYLLFLSVLITSIFLFYFFRSIYPVIFSLVVVTTGIIWSLGILVLLDYKLTLISALIPALIVIIGVPNCIYLLNNYHHEYFLHKNKILALVRIIRKTGIATFLTNITTAIGFATLAFANVTILREFGITASLGILSTFLLSLTLIPVIFSLLPDPTPRQLKHLEIRFVRVFVNQINYFIHHHRKLVYLFTFLVILFSFWGITKIKSLSFMLDDLGETNHIYADLRFFENNFNGVLPFEIVLESDKKLSGNRLGYLQKIEKLERIMSNHSYFVHPISVNNFVRFTTQAFYNGEPEHYRLPNKQESIFISNYLSNSDKYNTLMRSFVDSSGNKTRISYKIKDIGSHKLDSIIKKITPEINYIFQNTGIKLKLTGAMLIYMKGNKYLIRNLIGSLIMALIFIGGIVAILFYSTRMMGMIMITNLIPLLVTGGIMGFFNIPLKPSTAIIFGIAFGIAVDTGIHLLARYRQEFIHHRSDTILNAVSNSIKDTALSMISTSVILFFGFIIFATSDFGGTVALGILISITLMIALLTNLILLPSLLLSLEKRKRIRESTRALFAAYDEYSDEQDINLDRLEIEEIKKEIGR